MQEELNPTISTICQNHSHLLGLDEGVGDLEVLKEGFVEPGVLSRCVADNKSL